MRASRIILGPTCGVLPFLLLDCHTAWMLAHSLKRIGLQDEQK